MSAVLLKFGLVPVIRLMLKCIQDNNKRIFSSLERHCWCLGTHRFQFPSTADSLLSQLVYSSKKTQKMRRIISRLLFTINLPCVLFGWIQETCLLFYYQWRVFLNTCPILSLFKCTTPFHMSIFKWRADLEHIEKSIVILLDATPWRIALSSMIIINIIENVAEVGKSGRRMWRQTWKNSATKLYSSPTCTLSGLSV